MAWIPIGNMRDISVGEPPGFRDTQSRLSKTRTTDELLFTTMVVGAFLTSRDKTAAMIAALLSTLETSNVAL